MRWGSRCERGALPSRRRPAADPMLHSRRVIGATLFAVAVALSSAGAQPGLTEADMNAAIAPLDHRLASITQLKEPSPQQYVEAMLVWIDDLAAVGEKFESVSQSSGVRTRATQEMMKLASFARTRMREPERAIAIYRRAAERGAKARPGFGALEMDEQIADIDEFDLNDRVAAAATFRHIRDTTAGAGKQSRADYQAWAEWRRKWFDAEIAFLENGRRFDGPISAADLSGFAQQIYFLVGAAEGDLPFNIYDVPDRLSAATRDKLLQLPGSHGTFLHTWLYAARLQSAADAKVWLDRNDRAGFWTASLLALTAVADRTIGEKRIDTKRDLVSGLARMPSGQVTGFAILGRAYAKNHVLPTLPIAKSGPR